VLLRFADIKDWQSGASRVKRTLKIAKDCFLLYISEGSKGSKPKKGLAEQQSDISG